MKARVPHQFTSKEKNVMRLAVRKAVQKAVIKAQWLFAVALNEEYGFGKDRLDRLFARYDSIVEEYGGLQEDDAGDVKLLKRIRQIGLDVKGLYGGLDNE